MLVVGAFEFKKRSNHMEGAVVFRPRSRDRPERGFSPVHFARYGSPEGALIVAQMFSRGKPAAPSKARADFTLTHY